MMYFRSACLWSVVASVTACAPSTRSPYGPPQPPVPRAPAGVTAFVDVNVVPMDTERVLPAQTVLVKDGWITGLGSASQVTVPAGAIRIDGRGKYLIPGLGDCHAHIGRGDSADYDSVTAEGRLFLWAASGVTVIRNMDYSPMQLFRMQGPALLRLKARAAAGVLWSPRIYTSAPWAPAQYLFKKSSNSGSGVYAITVPKVPPRLDSVAAYVAAYKAAGFDHIKNYNEYASLEIRDSMVAAAHRVGMPIVGHAFEKKPREWLWANMKSLEHLTGYSSNDTALYQKMAESTQRAGIWNCVTLGVVKAMEAGYRPELVKALQQAGAGLLLGTDAPLIPIVNGAQIELEALVQAGLTPYQALVTGTRNMAAYFGTLDSVGTVTVGKRADLVLLNGNPIEEIQQARRIAGVMIGGRWLSREEIDRRVPTIDAKGPCPQNEVMTWVGKCKEAPTK